MSLSGKAALVTGASRRLGAQIVRSLHAQGVDIILHYAQSHSEAKALAAELNAQRPDSVVLQSAHLDNLQDIETLAQSACTAFGQLDLLINNASRFYPTPIGNINENDVDTLFGSNFKAPLFLSQACAPSLKAARGQIINMVDIYARSPLPQHTVYTCAKAANAMLVRSLALELGPEIRVNGVAPGAILWPENDNSAEIERQQKILEQIPLGKTGTPQNIADSVLFLAQNDYINGQIIAVDGGRQLF